MKNFMKWSGISAFIMLLIILLLTINIIYFRPFSIHVFYEITFFKYALKDPEKLSSMRILEQFGLYFHNDELTDLSPKHSLELNDMHIENYQTLKSYDRSKLEGQAAFSYDVLEWFLQNQIDGIKYTWHAYPVNQLFGIQNQLPKFMANTHHIGNIRDARHYITRLSRFGNKFDQLLEDLKLREAKKIIPPRFMVEKVLHEMNGFRSQDYKENVLYTSFVKRINKLADASDKQKTELTQTVIKEIENTVYPAYERLIAYFRYLQNHAVSNHGVWKLPDGDNYYNYMLRRHTTTHLEADEIHELGLAEVARIQADMDEILKKEGYTTGTVAERMSQLNTEKRFLYPNTDEGRKALLEHFRTVIAEIETDMPNYFNRLPKTKVEVKRIPEFSEKGSAGAYYRLPSMDGARPGMVYINLRDLKEHPKFGIRTLAYHEAIPGHHLQLAIKTELKNVPSFHRIFSFNAFTEGWALYAERLAWETGYQQDVYDNLGRLQAELFRAVRLVVDTGIHRKRWSREKAIEYMLSNTGYTLNDVIAEVERYFVIPGQATSYKIGMIKFLELREKAKRVLGHCFDIREFHDKLISDGDIPLVILEHKIDKWLKVTQRNCSKAAVEISTP